MSELDQRIVTCKLRVERLQNELLLATADLMRLGLEKEKALKNSEVAAESNNV